MTQTSSEVVDGATPDGVAHAAPAEPVLGVPQEEVQLLLPTSVLDGGELVLLVLKPSLWFVVLSSLGSLSLLVALAAAAAVLHIAGMWVWARPEQWVAMAMTLVALRLGWQLVEWFSHVYVLTDRRVIRVRGIWRPLIFAVPLGRLQSPTLEASFRERLFGLGTVHFATVGDAERARWMMVRRPQEVYRCVLQTLGRFRRDAG